MKLHSLLGGTFLAVLLFLVSCEGKTKADPEMVEVLRSIVEKESAACPQQFNNMVLESVTYDSNVFRYSYIVEGEDLQDNNSKEVLKAMYKLRPDLQPFLKALIGARAKLVYHYYTKGGKTFDVELSASELESLLK